MEQMITEPELGPFQDMWDAWEDVRDELLDKPLSHFQRAAEIQFEELAEHLAAGDREAAAREATDVISVALNLLRSLGYTPAEIGIIARSRAAQRMQGRTQQILEKYQRDYDI
ncbi:hypothetical protein [Actinomadura fibrosa]|uniref:NTP pyrophosphohydrolase MazG putative catalytic core domain-containing protein n=1 Tax=Actinomadura fibrosa TaxID=111802 RepID=A0ABW2XL78_9ACTN|nr:hypothetical protein [Actinomadura fibrosa]